MKKNRNLNMAAFFMNRKERNKYRGFLFLIWITFCLSTAKSQYTQSRITLYSVNPEGKAGYINKNGKIIVEPQYEQIPQYLAGTVFWAKRNGKYFLMDIKGINVGKMEFENVKESEVYGKWIFKKNGKWGGLDSSGNIIIPFNFDAIDYFSGGFALAQLNGQKGYIDEKGEFTFFSNEYIYENIGEGFFSIKKNQLIGLYDAGKKKIVLKPQYSQISRIRYGQVAVLIPKPYSYSIYDCSKNKLIVKPGSYQNIWMSFSNPNKNYFVGNELLYTEKEDSVYLAIRSLNTGIVKNVYCVLDYSGKEIAILDTNYTYNSEALFFYGLSAYSHKDKKGIMDKSGKVIAEPIFDMVMNCTNGLIPVQQNGKWGYMDVKGNMAIPFEFENYGFFVNGLAYVNKVEGTTKKRGYIDKKGNWVWYQIKQ